MTIKKQQNYGFTIIEILVVAPIVILVIGAFIGAIVNITGDVLATRGASSLSYSIQDALNQIEQDIKLSDGFLAINNFSLVTPQGYDNGTSNFHNVDATNGTMLILNYPATTDNPLNAVQNIYAVGQPNPCGSSKVSRNTKVEFNVIYFVKNNTLWRRVVAPYNYAAVGCSVPWQQPSCAPGVVNAFCKTEDQKLVDGITASGFKVDYYVSSGATSPITNNDASDANRQISLMAASTAVVSISATNSVAGRDVSQTGSIRSVSRNTNFSIPADITTPGAPTSLTATPGVGQIVLNWTAPASNGNTPIIGYKVYRSATTGTETLYATIGNVTTYTNSGLGSGAKFYYTVRATNAVGDGNQSNEANATST